MLLAPLRSRRCERAAADLVPMDRPRQDDVFNKDVCDLKTRSVDLPEFALHRKYIGIFTVIATATLRLRRQTALPKRAFDGQRQRTRCPSWAAEKGVVLFRLTLCQDLRPLASRLIDDGLDDLRLAKGMERPWLERDGPLSTGR